MNKKIHLSNNNSQILSQSEKRLYNVDVIRLILIILLVFYHAFANFGGAWPKIQGIGENSFYWWMDKLSYACLLETFVFISGFVFGFQVRTKGIRKLNLKSLLWSKFKRLILPSILFSILYILLFQDITQPIEWTIYEVVRGVAHMWFLPMLFWCFLSVWLIETINIKSSSAILILLIISCFQYNGLPLQLGYTMYYLVFFYGGYVLQKYDIQLERYYTLRNLFLSIILFLVSFVCLTLFRENIQSVFTSKNIFVQGAKFLTDNSCQLLYSSIGVAMIMIMVGYFINLGIKPTAWIIKIGGLSFGVYLLQQFVLRGLYYYSSLPAICGELFLPWAGFLITLIVSIMGAWVIKQTKAGRLII